AGGLVWSAPLLLSGIAAADPAVNACCTHGTPVTVKVSSASGVDCNGTGCIDQRAAANSQFQSFSAQCAQFQTCLNMTIGTKKLVTVNSFNTSSGSANITIAQGITV